MFSEFIDEKSKTTEIKEKGTTKSEKSFGKIKKEFQDVIELLFNQKNFLNYKLLGGHVTLQILQKKLGDDAKYTYSLNFEVKIAPTDAITDLTKERASEISILNIHLAKNEASTTLLKDEFLKRSNERIKQFFDETVSGTYKIEMDKIKHRFPQAFKPSFSLKTNQSKY